MLLASPLRAVDVQCFGFKYVAARGLLDIGGALGGGGNSLQWTVQYTCKL